MSDSFKTTLCKDSTIADITPDLVYSVKSGAAQTTYQKFPATAASSSTMIFSVQVPSENIVIGRDVLVECNMAATLNVGTQTNYITEPNVESSTSTPGGTLPILEFGGNLALHVFPLGSLMNTASATINNTSVSSNVKDILPSLLRQNDSRFLYKYNGMSPSLPDQSFKAYTQMVGSNSNALASYNNTSYDLDQQPRGVHPVELIWTHYGNLSTYTISTTTTVTSTSTNITYADHGIYPNAQAYWTQAAAEAANSVLADPEDVVYYATNQWWTLEVRTKVTEPIFLSPFTWGAPEHNAQGFLGINNMAFNFTIDSTLSRMFSDGTGLSGATGVAVTVNKTGNSVQSNLFENTQMLLKFLSTQPSDRLETKNVVPFMDFPRYLTNTNSTSTMAAATLVRSEVSGAYTLTPSSATVLSNSIQLNQIPDYFIICVRKPMTTQTLQDSDSFLAIESISVNLNNASGLLSSASQQDLWRLSQKNGCNQNWQEFSGQAFDNKALTTVSGLSSNDAPANVATTGSLLVLSPPMDLSLPDYLSSGSLGNFNFQITLNVKNYGLEEVTPEVCVICVNSGIFITQQGVSSVYSGILTREMTLKTKSMSAESSCEANRLIGGQMLNRNPMRRIARMVGGALSGGAVSGGAKHGSSLSGMY
jgi:hypothetical protein